MTGPAGPAGGTEPADHPLRYARADEFAAVAELDGASFGFHYSAAELEDALLDVDAGRILVATDGPRIVAASAEVPFRMSLPGGDDVAVTGLSWVSVELTHRRRGILRRMVDRQVRAAADAGDAAVVLTASEGAIYGRYGFGVATQARRIRVQRRRARVAEPVDAPAVRRLPTAEAAAVLPALHERWRRRTPGGLSRDERRWRFLLLDRDWQRHGYSGLFHLVHPDGYVSYRIKPDWNDGDPQHTCLIVDYAPGGDEAHRALWQTLLAMDLVAAVESYRVPADDPLPMLLADPRGVDTTHLGDGLWVRPVDVGTLLGRRRYGVEVDCVLEVRDALLGDARFALSGGPDAARVARTERLPDVVLSAADVGAVSLGGVRLGRLARAGRVGCDDAGLLRRLDLALLAERDPAHGTAF